MDRKLRYLPYLLPVAITLVLCEAAFRAYDAATNPIVNIDGWIKKESAELQDHPLLGYAYPPHKTRGDDWEADAFGLPNVAEALQWNQVDVVGIGDSYVDVADRVFFNQFKSRSLRYHSLALFGYGPGQYNVLLEQYGLTFRPKIFLYVVYVGNDPGDVRRYEAWRASGKGWFAFNGGYFTPIERQGCCWGWRLFTGRAKRFSRNIVSRLSRETYQKFKGVLKADDAETVFPYVARADQLARRHGIPLLMLIVPRIADHKPYLDPIANNLIALCSTAGLDCLDLDAAFGDPKTRSKFFAEDGHWNELGERTAWTYVWDRKLSTLFEFAEHSASASAK
jgi:hypothetical protein